MKEDELVAELNQIGINYLSNRPTTHRANRGTPVRLLADIVCQPSSRVRSAAIALFLMRPGYSEFVPAAAKLLNDNQRLLLKLFYTAAVHLQRLYQSDLLPIAGSNWVWLPDLYGEEFGVPSGLLPEDAIQQIGIRHQELTHTLTNWSGTYKNAVDHLIRYKQREMLWNR